MEDNFSKDWGDDGGEDGATTLVCCFGLAPFRHERSSQNAGVSLPKCSRSEPECERQRAKLENASVSEPKCSRSEPECERQRAQMRAQRAHFLRKSPSAPSFSHFKNRHFFAQKWFYLLKRTTFFLKTAILSR